MEEEVNNVKTRIPKGPMSLKEGIFIMQRPEAGEV